MLRTLHHILFAAALLAIALSAESWLNSRRQEHNLAATIASQNTLLAQAAASERQRDALLAEKLAAINDQKRHIRTPLQAVAAIPSALPELPLPVTVTVPDEDANPDQADSVPATISVPQPDLMPLYDSLQDCRACALKLDTTQKDLAEEKLRVAAAIRERNAAISEAHGETFWRRLKRNAKWFAIGIAAATAASIAQHR